MKRKRVNKQKMTQKNRDLGLEHVNISTKKVVPASMGIRCDSDKCAKLFKRECQKVSGDVRHQIFTDYYSIGNLQLQS